MTINRFKNYLFPHRFFGILLFISELTLADQTPEQAYDDFINPNLNDVFISQNAKSALGNVPNINTLAIPLNGKQQWDQLVTSKFKYDDKFLIQSGDFTANNNLKSGTIIGHLPGYILAVHCLGESFTNTDEGILTILRERHFNNGLLIDEYAPTIHLKSAETLLQLIPLESGLNPLILLKVSDSNSNLRYILAKSDKSATPILAIETTRDISKGESLFIRRMSAGGNYYIESTINSIFRMRSKQVKEERIRDAEEDIIENLKEFTYKEDSYKKFKLLEKIWGSIE